MKSYCLRTLVAALGAATLAAGAAPASAFDWQVVVNNNDAIPDVVPERSFNSYNQPSVNLNGLVVMRARSRGGPPLGPATHGIYTRDMSVDGSPIVRILDRGSLVPKPNNQETLFVETPSFPRIDMDSNVIATRGNHQPVWKEGDDEASGTTGIYTNPFGPLITGASKLGAVSEFWFFEVPEAPGTPFDVFPGAPAVTDGATIVFKGNYTDEEGVGKTGVYYRDLTDEPIRLDDGAVLQPAGGTNPVVLIANNTETCIPNTETVFGSTAPPSAADGLVVFAGFDDEEAPTLGGIYLADLDDYPAVAVLENRADCAETTDLLTPLVEIGDPVPGENPIARFNRLGEGVAFDGRYVAFWGAWGPATRTIRLHCPTEGNQDRIAFCLLQCPEPAGCSTKLPVRQGVFVHDIKTGDTAAVAKAPNDFGDFIFWNFSGQVPGIGEGGEGAEDDGEPARWRFSAFVAVSGTNTAFKATTGNRVGVYLSRQPGQKAVTVVDSDTDGQVLDPKAAPIGSTLVEVGLEREGLRGDWLAISAKMAIKGGTEEDGMAGVYITRLPSL